MQQPPKSAHRWSGRLKNLANSINPGLKMDRQKFSIIQTLPPLVYHSAFPSWLGSLSACSHTFDSKLGSSEGQALMRDGRPTMNT
jgi:hypothetical protein